MPLLDLGSLHTRLKTMKVQDLADAMVVDLKIRKKDLYCDTKMKTKAELLDMVKKKIDAEKSKIMERSQHRHSKRIRRN